MASDWEFVHDLASKADWKAGLREMFMDQASSACHHMMFLINDLLDTAAHDAGGLRLDMQTCYTHDLLDDALRILMPVAVVNNITVDLVKPDEDLPVRGDPNRAMQVIFNMVGNAVKFSTPQSEISLRAYRLEDTVVFEIEDEGIGVTESVVDSLFTRFGRVHDSSSSTARGHGIGLYMSKVLIEKMGGTIGYRPREEGT